MRSFGIGLLGFGTVGAGVVAALQKRGDLVADRTGLRLELKGIADLDLDSDRGVPVDRALLTKDALAVINNPDVHIVVELIGGLKAARKFILAALECRKPVVTANKALLAEHGEEIFAAAEKNDVDVFYEGSVGGAIPIIRALREGLVANDIESIHGILNGTCNYILTRMEQSNMAFADVLKEAKKAGYAEAEPSLDIDGTDTAHKAVILAGLAYGRPVPMSAVHVEGIRGLDPMDIQYAKELGYRIKLLAIIKNDGGEVEVRVQPTFVSLRHTLAWVSDVFNAVLVKGDIAGETLYYGRGAGRMPTASAIVGDLVDAARNLDFESQSRVPPFVRHDRYDKLRSIEDIRSRCYLRLSLLDRPGIMARAAAILGDHHISIASVLQKEMGSGEHVPVIIVTHEAQERDFRSALAKIDAMDVVGAPTVRFRIEDFA